jgi:hypothetical protein
MNTAAIALFAIVPTLVGQTAAQSGTPKAPIDEALRFMIGTLEPIRLTDASSGALLQLKRDPAFRMGKQPADIVQEGAIFFWLDPIGRPEAAVQVFMIRDSNASAGTWLHEFVSLSPHALSSQAGSRAPWNPQTPGVAFKAVPGAPRPADTASQRDRQLKALAREFHAVDYFHEKSWYDLRLLPTPVARYGQPNSDVLDGALFTFVTGTDPEAFLFLEVRQGESGLEWQYAFAPMTCWELKGSHHGTNVWTIPMRRVAGDPSRPYFTRAIEGPP